MQQTRLIHFGDHCEPTFLIRDIMKSTFISPFMLGIFPVNDIIKCLQTDSLHDLYAREYFVKEDYTRMRHSKLNFRLNHDYTYGQGNNLSNYDIVKDRFLQKIKNWDTMLYEETGPIVLITFTSVVDHIRFNDAMAWFRERNVADRITWVVFTNMPYFPPRVKGVHIVKLVHPYVNWWKPDINHSLLVDEVRTKFQEILDKYVKV